MDSQITKKLVGVWGEPPGKPYNLLFAALSRLYPVDFRKIEGPETCGLDALVILNGNLAAGLAAAVKGVSAFVVTGGPNEPEKRADQQVRFGNSTELVSCLRNQMMVDRQDTGFRPLEAEAGD